MLKATYTIQNQGSDLHSLLFEKSDSFKQENRKTRDILSILNKELSKELEILNEKKRQITDSINYAQRLQNALLPTSSEINSFVKDHFILNMPKSIISGDFYFVDSFITKDQEKLTAIGLADCTGHGVPGALLSTLSYSILKNALKDKSIHSAGEVLDHLKDKVSNVFREDPMLGRIRDGMDMSLCIFDPQTKLLQYAGANQKGLIIKTNKEVIELTPNKQHIGYNECNSKFTTHMIQLTEGDTIYLFSDGFRDQFGGESGKKLQYKTFAEKLLSITSFELFEQRNMLIDFFNEWKKDASQTDDVLVLAARI